MARPIKFRDIKTDYINAENEFIFSDSSTQNTASCISYSFLLDIAGGSYGAATIGIVQPFFLDILNNIKGIPILPHGVGTYFNMYGTYINGRVSNWANKPVSYGHYQASRGEITHMEINYDFTSWEGFPIHIRAANYTNGTISDSILISEFEEFLVGSKSIKFDNPLDFENNSHIGIFIEDTGGNPIRPRIDTGCIIEGSLLVKLKA